MYRKYKVSGDRPLESTASAVRKNVRWQRIVDESHPAKGENGLFAARSFSPGEHIVDYLGYVTLSGNEDQTSDYSASFGDDHELALDAAKVGNEARMCNDFRNTGKRANAVFDQYRDAAGDQKLAIFVGPHPLGKGEEVLVSYGKGFWANRVGNLAAFTSAITRTANPDSSSRPTSLYSCQLVVRFDSDSNVDAASLHSSSSEDSSSEDSSSLSESASRSQSTNGCASLRNRLSSSSAPCFSSAHARTLTSLSTSIS